MHSNKATLLSTASRPFWYSAGMKFVLRLIALSSSLTLACGCIWTSHTWANPRLMPGSKSYAISLPTNRLKPLWKAMPGTNSAALLVPGKSNAVIPLDPPPR